MDKNEYLGFELILIVLNNFFENNLYLNSSGNIWQKGKLRFVESVMGNIYTGIKNIERDWFCFRTRLLKIRSERLSYF